jgi:hypothetical protein
MVQRLRVRLLQLRQDVPRWRQELPSTGRAHLGRSQVAEGQFWALDHPASPGYASKYGIPEENVRIFDFVEQGRIPSEGPFVTREGQVSVITPEAELKL